MPRALTLLCLGLFVAGTCLALRPIVGPRPLGRNKSHAFANPRPKGRSRLEAPSSTEADPASIARIASIPASSMRRQHPSTARIRPARGPAPGPRPDLPALAASPHLALHLRC